MLPSGDSSQLQTHTLKSEGAEDDTPRYGSQKKVGVDIHTSDNIDFKTKLVTRDKAGHYIIMIKESIQIFLTYERVTS